jgi:hypothetical protein
LKDEPAAGVLSRRQWLMVDRLTRFTLRWTVAARGAAAALERSKAKFVSLSEVVSSLATAAESLEGELLPYARRSSQVKPAAGESSAAPCVIVVNLPGIASLSEKDAFVSIPACISAAKEIEADRIKFVHKPSFNALPYISDPMLRAGFVQPKHLRLPPALWPPVKRARVRCKLDEQLKLYKKWDSVGSLHLMLASQSDCENLTFSIGRFSTRSRKTPEAGP